MVEWWGLLVYLTFMGAYLGHVANGGLGLIFGALIGFCIGALLPVGPSIDFDPNDL